MEYADRGLINGSRLNGRLKLSGLARSSAPLNDHLLLLHLTPSGFWVAALRCPNVCLSEHLSTRHHRPDDPGKLVGYGNGHDHRTPSLQ